MIRRRVRIRFRKEEDLRLISHRDLVRTFERLFRRCGIKLRMSEGFHPKAKMTVPAALALGIEGRHEVMEFELAEDVDDAQLLKRMNEQCPVGLEITALQQLAEGQPKARVRFASYVIPIPSSRQATIEKRISELGEEKTHMVYREGRREPLELKADLTEIALENGELRFRLHLGDGASVRPREVLEALEAGDLEDEGYHLTRIDVEIA